MEPVTLVRCRPYFPENADWTHRVDVYRNRQKIGEIYRLTDNPNLGPGTHFHAVRDMPGGWEQSKGFVFSLRSAVRLLTPEV